LTIHSPVEARRAGSAHCEAHDSSTR
jgi:hypothetical protein